MTSRGIQHIHLFSDATGETVERVVRAVLSQFRDVDIRLHRWNRLRKQEDILKALDETLKEPGLVVYTLVNTELAEVLRNQAEAYGLETVDLITPLLYKMAEFLSTAPQQEPGLLYQLNAEYYKRMDAVNFTVKMDDGQEPRSLYKADVVLVGVSRSSKTPLSMYLANRGYKVANVPLVKGIDPPKELEEVDEAKVFGLVIDPKRLVELRSERLRYLHQNPRGHYADYEKVAEEVDFCRRYFRRHPRWFIIDVTKKSVEESASEIMKRLSGQISY